MYFFLEFFFLFDWLNLTKALAWRLIFWDSFARNQKVTEQGTDNSFVIIRTILNFAVDVALSLHTFAMFLCTIHIFVEFIAALRFIVAIWFDLVDSICMPPELVLKTFLKIGQFYFSFTQRTFAWSESTTDTVEQGMKNVQSQQ